MKRIFRSISLLCISFLITSAAYASDLVVYSQNMLHFGQGAAAVTASQCAAIDTMSATADIILIQELMTSDYPCKDASKKTKLPVGFSFASWGPLGPSTYEEYYGFLWRSTASIGKPKIEDLDADESAPGAYMRPPHALAFKVTRAGGGSNFIMYVGNMHSIYGTKGVKPRQDEATLAGNFFTTLRNKAKIGTVNKPAQGWPVIFGGDWNIPVAYKNNTLNPGFAWLTAANAEGTPTNVATSVTKAGKLSSPYDHFIYNKVINYSGTDHGITIDSLNYNPASSSSGTLATWWSTTSDHRGIYVGITVK